MKNRTALRFYVVLIILSCTTTIYAQRQAFLNIDWMYGEYPFTITCDEFEKGCSYKHVKLSVVEKKEFIALLDNMPCLNKKVTIDTRYKGVVNSMNICGNEIFMCVDGKYFETSKAMAKFLEKLYISRCTKEELSLPPIPD